VEPPVTATPLQSHDRETGQASPRWPALVVTAALLALAALATPRAVERWVSLQWRIGDLRPVLAAWQLLALLLALGALLSRSRLNRRAGAVLRRPRRVAFAAAAVLLGLALALVAGELLLRLAGWPYSTSWQPAENAIGRFDEALGWSYRPGASVVQTFGAPPRSVPVHVGPDGARVAAPGARHVEGAPSVLFVGCSYTMGHGVTYEESFAGRLAADPSFRLQAVNLGVQGYGTDQALIALLRHIDRFDTRFVVYTFHPSHVERNEVADRRVLWPSARFLGTKPRFEITGDGALELRDRPVRYEERMRPRLLDALDRAGRRFGPLPSAALTSRLVQEMERLASERGAVLLVVLWTRAHDGGPDAVRRVLFPWLDPRRAIDVGAGAPAGWDDWVIPGDGHPDERAQARVAALLRAKMDEPGLVAGRSSTPIARSAP
jgi:hypothetical protein